MRILFLTAQLPEPAHAGGTLRTSGLMRGVHAAGHEVHLLCFGDPAIFAAHQHTLNGFCADVEVIPPPHRTLKRRLLDLLLTQLADMQRRFDSPLFADRLETRLKQGTYDLIQIESLEMAVYLPVIQRFQSATPVIYDSFNAEYDLQRTIFNAEKRLPRRWLGALYSLIQWRRLTRFERDVCQSVAHVIAVSQADAAAFERLAPGCPVSVVSNGIRADHYAEDDTSLDLGQHALVFTGSMGYRPNVDAALWFAEDILGIVRSRIPDTRFFIVGSQPHSRLNRLRQFGHIEVTGWVPDINPFLHAAAVYVAPLRMGSGTRLKLLQAMAAGQAVVSTSIGALGLDVQDGVELRLADTADDFAQAIIDLLEHPEQRQALGTAGAHYVAARHDWSVIVPDLLRVYEKITHVSSRNKRYEQTPITST